MSSYCWERARPRSLVAGLIALFFIAIPLHAQDAGTIAGTVTADDGSVMSSVQISVEGTSLGALSDGGGQYQITNVPAGEYTVVAQSLGYGTVREEGVSVTAGQTTEINFQLARRALELSGIVVTGVTEATERANVPFSVGRLSSDDMPVMPTSAVGALQSRVAGAQVVQSSRPGVSDNIMLRTPTSVNRSNQPLFVVDGVILTESDVDISSMDIESIEVVKGAAAASLYGSRAAAGVVQIRTVRGSSHEEGQTVFRVRSEFGTSEIANPIAWAQHHNFRMNDQGQFIGSDGQVAEDRSQAATTRFGFQDQQYPGAVYDNIGALFSPGNTQSHQVSLGHNAAGTGWQATAGRQTEGGVVRGHDGYERTDLRLNVDHRPRDDLSVSVNAFHMRSFRDNLPGNTFFDFIQIAPDVDLLQPDPDGTPFVFQPDPQGIRVNPLYRIHNQTHEDRRTRTLAGADARYSPLSWLSVDVNVSYDRSDREGFNWIPRGSKTDDRPDGGDGESNRFSAFTDGLNASGGISLTRFFGDLRARTAIRGLIEEENRNQISAGGSNMAVGGIPDLGVNQSVSIGSLEETVRSTGGFLTTELDYDNRYIMNALVRRDGSSLFGPDQRWHTYYRLSGAYRMASEDWWPFDDIGEFRLRYSRGTAGGRPNFADRFEVFNVGSGGTLSLATLGNRELRPEKTTEQEFGIDVIAFDRLSVEMVYARQETVDQLIQVPLPSMFGFGSQWQNAGTIEGSTFEVQANFAVLERPNFTWMAGIVADRSTNRITAYDSPCFLDGNLYRCAGERFGTMWGQRFATGFEDIGHLHDSGSAGAFQVNDDGLLVAVGEGNSWRDGVSQELWGSTVTVDGREYDWGMPIMQVDEDGQRQLHRIGDSNPDLTLGFSNTVNWGQVSLYGLLDTQFGGEVYNRTKQRMYQWARAGDQDQVGRSDEEKKPLSYYSSYLYDVNRRNSWFVEDASFVRLRELSVSYNMDANRFGFLQGTGVDRVNLSLVGRNLIYWTDYSGYDPSVGTSINRDDNFAYPSYRSLTASVDIRF
jgi:TonB-linked SusC/RagA family outer membrane protein